MISKQYLIKQQCRTCYESTKNLQFLTSYSEESCPSPQQQTPKTYAQLLSEVCNINPMEDLQPDQWPQFICSPCSEKLQSAYDFIQQTQKVNKFLKSFVKEPQVESYIEYLIKPELDIPLEIKEEPENHMPVMEIQEHEILYRPMEMEEVKSEIIVPTDTDENRQRIMECNSPGKQDGNVKKYLIESISTDSSAEKNSDSCSSSLFSKDEEDYFIDTTYIPYWQANSALDNCDANITNVESPIISKSDANVADNENPMVLTSLLEKEVNRKGNENNWQRTVNKKLRNSGKEYTMKSTGKKVRKERKMQPPCTEKCKLKCFEKFTEEERMVIFHSYWDLGDIQKQRIFIHNNMEPIQQKYRYVREGGTRKKRDNNNAFYLCRNGQKVRVCKLFFKNTLNINDRPIRTVQKKRNKVANVLLEDDRRGKHGKQKKIDEVLKQGVKNFIDKIPKIESHYTRANTTKHFIDGSKTIAEIHRGYMAECKSINVPFVNYVMFYRIFTEDYNISFFCPKT